MKLKLNLYPVLPDMEERLSALMQEAVDKRAISVELSCGPASDTVKKRVLSYLNKKEVRQMYSRLEKTDKGWSRIYIHFRWE